MSVALSAALAAWLLYLYRKSEDDPLLGMASIIFWLVCAGASYVVSGGLPTDIYFYFFWAAVGMFLALLIDLLHFAPERKRKGQENEEEEEKPKNNNPTSDEWREAHHMRRLNRSK